MDRFEIPHGEQTLYMHPFTTGIKQAFVTWLRPRYILEALQIAKDAAASRKEDPASFTEEQVKELHTAADIARQEAYGGSIFWTADPSPAVAAAIRSQAGLTKLTRLQFPESMAGWTDEQIYGWVSDQPDGSPYFVTFMMLMEGADPKKATRPAPTSAGQTATSGPDTTSARPSISV